MTSESAAQGTVTARSLVVDLLAGRVGIIGSGLSLLLLGNAAGVALPLLARGLVDRTGRVEPAQLLWQLSALVVVAALLQAVGKYFSTRMVSVGAQASIARLRSRLHAHALALPMRHFHTTAVGTISSRIMQDVDAIRLLLGSGLLQLVGAVFTALLALGVLFWLHWVLTVSVMLVLLVVGLAFALLFARSRPLVRKRAAAQTELNARCTETFTGIRLIKAYGMESVAQRRFAERSTALFGDIRRSLQLAAWMSVVTVLAIAALTVLAIQIGGHALLAGNFSAGDMVAYGVLVGLLASPLATVANQGPEIGEAVQGLERIAAFLSLPVDAGGSVSVSAALPRLAGHVEFRDVGFSYEPGQPVLEHVNFTLPAGSLTAIVGLSGAGKSTLLSLLMGLERPQSGQVLIDRQDLRDLPAAAYRAQLGVVLQDDGLFEGTLLDNLRFGAEHAPETSVEQACRQAHVDEFSARLPDGLNTWVGVGGQMLSGGQRQRVAIARALLRDPAVLILDEATSHLDNHSEAMVQAGLRTLQRGRTTVVVAYRPSTLEGADQILAVEQGRVRVLSALGSPEPVPGNP